MGLINSKKEYDIEFKDLKTPMECLEYFNNEEDTEKKHYALDSLKNFPGGELVLLSILIDGEIDPRHTNYVASILGKAKLSERLVDGLFSLLEVENAHLRNIAVEILQEQGENLDPFFEKYLDTKLRDTKILIANILGNTKLKKSREYLIKLIQKEDDINIVMTCVEYLGEIGKKEDIALLEALMNKFKDSSFAKFAIEKSIKEIRDYDE